MRRPWFVVLLGALVVGTAPVRSTDQDAGVLHIQVALVEAEKRPRPIPRHALLISDDPVTAAPRRVVTRPDGTVDVRLKAGTYVIESDQPVAFQGKAYTWRQVVTMEAGRDAILELNAANAEVEKAEAASTVDLESLFEQWQDSVVTVWSETSYGLGFLVDPAGLIATSRRVIGASTSAEVEIAADKGETRKVAARVVAVRPDTDVAILWVNPKAVASLKPVRLGYAGGATPPVAAGQQIFSVGSPFHGRKFMTPATVSRVELRAIASDIVVDPGNAGAPVFAPDGQVIGMTTLIPGDDGSRGTPGVVRIDEARGALAEAEPKIRGGALPGDMALPFEPSRPFPVEALEADARRRMRNVIDYQLKAGDFDVTFITPVLTYGVYRRNRQADPRSGASRTVSPTSQDLMLSVDSFENWAEYAAEFPPVIMIRVTPRLVEGFWSMVGRQAARTQGIFLPPMARHVKAGFSTMRVLCGEAELTPVHPFRIGHRVPAKGDSAKADEVVYEGLYVFDPNAISPACGSVTLELFSEKSPAKGETRAVDARIVQQIWDDFGPWRAGGA